MKKLTLPIDEATIRSLKVGDEVSIYGTIVTGRDAAHKYMVEESPKWLDPILAGTFIYHCGPVVQKDSAGRWQFVSAGPTTSAREEPYQAKVFERYKVRGVIGKGGMGPKTLEGCQRLGAVYLHAVGGAAVTQAAAVKEVLDVKMLEELGTPEAFWIIRVEDFRAVVTMDSHGGSLHAEVLADSKKRFEELVK